jgi:gliding motility-associated-like protein
MILVLISMYGSAQGYLEFVENKGQWDPAIRFKGEMTTGAFALQATGYRVLLHKGADLVGLTEKMHGHGNSNSGGKPANGGAPPVQVKTNALTERHPPEDGGGGGSGTGNAGDRPVIVHSHAYEVKFLNANEQAQIIPEKPLPGNINYLIGNDSTKWASGCTSYQAITYKNLYPGIDVRYYTAGGVLKYDLIVSPGADISQVAMYYEGAGGLRVKDGKLLVKTSVEEVQEFPPYSYQLLNSQRLEVPCSYEVKGNIVRFRINGAYAKTATLVVDPSFVFSSFSGSTASNWGYTATYDGQGNFYGGGIVFGGNGRFPVSNGAFQTSFQGGSNTGEGGGFDIGIIKLDPFGTNRIYATYLGGATGNEQPHSLFVDQNGNLVIAGRSNSSDYPVKGSLQKYGPCGGWDIILTKLNQNGTGLVSSLRIGGSADDGVNIRPKYSGPKGAQSINRNYGDDARSEVIIDGAGNIYLASCTQSDDFPTTPGAFQSVSGGNLGSHQDGVVLKFNSNLSTVLFSTRIGGSGDDAAFVLALNPLNGDLYVGGATASNDFPGDKTGTISSSFNQGICDGFVAQFHNDGSFVKSTYIGTAGDDMLYGIQFDKFGFPYIMGTTTGSWPIKKPAGATSFYTQTNGKQFISKLKPDLSDYVYSTVFGTNNPFPNISPVAFLVDRCENVYLSGWGGGIDSHNNFPNATTVGLPVTGGGQTVTDGDDFYFFVLERDAKSQLFGSFFGQQGGATGEHVDGGTSRFDRNGIIYQAICANCGGGARFPTTGGVWAPNNGAAPSGCNLAMVKIAFNLAGVEAGIQTSINGRLRDTTGCVPLTADFRDTLAMGRTYVWNFGDGTPPVTTSSPNISHTFALVGNYRVKLTSVDSSSCNVLDSSFVIMRVRSDEVKMSFTSKKLPPCTSLQYEFNNTSTAPPGKPLSNQSFLWMFGDNTTQVSGTGKVVHSYQAAGTYTIKLVLLDTAYCNYDDTVSVQIRIADNLKAQFVTPAAGCVPYRAVFDNTSVGGQQFTWDFGDGTGSTQSNPTHVYSNVGTYQVKLVAVDSSTCNIKDSATFSITVNPNPKAGFTYAPEPTQANTPVTFTNSSLGATKYKWIFDDGDTLFTIRKDTTVSHLYNYSDKFKTCLVAYNDAGCSDTTCQLISITIVPGMDIPNAFTPNGDGINDKIYVRGFGISKLIWRIYNRWGVLVYVGTDKREGWDGMYKGVLQPQDVYHYTALVEFADGTKVTKKGDITLLR